MTLCRDPMARGRSALELGKEARPVGNQGELQERVAAEPDDHQARFELAGGMMAEGDNDGAAEALLEIIRRDREWNDGAARTQLLKLFEVVGLEDPWVSSQRRRLRSEEHTSELQSLMRISYAVFCLKKKNHQTTNVTSEHHRCET